MTPPAGALPRLLFLGGCPRSGTTWLQLMLGALPGVRTGRETHVFRVYADALLRGYQSEAALRSDDGIRHLFDAARFEAELVRPMVETVLRRLAPGAGPDETLLEKTPSNLRYHDLIARLFPEARLLAIIRDPRAVAASWKAAAGEAWGAWTRKPIADVAAGWVTYAEAAIAAEVAGPRFHLVRYEDLHTDGPGVLRGIAAWAGIAADAGAIAEAVARHRLPAVKQALALSGRVGGLAEDRPNFFRRGEVAGWATELAPEEVATVEAVCRPLMARFGYGPAAAA